MEPIQWILLGLATFLFLVWAPVLKEICAKRKKK